MSYYPDTDEIRMAYVKANQSNAFGSDEHTLSVEFNRWFEYEQDKVAKATEQRIIKLLEEHKATRSPMVTLPYAIEQAILIIKGETK